mgnify:CR=1 FL=1|tara:strand:- start:644 stop:883 length:240 start_codon:yes stop_codon:yes gene_type:complete
MSNEIKLFNARKEIAILDVVVKFKEAELKILKEQPGFMQEAMLRAARSMADYRIKNIRNAMPESLSANPETYILVRGNL